MAVDDATYTHHLHHRGSVDQLFELVEGLDDTQIHSLLEDFNNTVTSNVPVSHGIEFFEHPSSMTRAKTTPTTTTATTTATAEPTRSSSIRKSFNKLPRLFTRSPSKRSASAPIQRPQTGLPPATRHYRRISRPVLPTLTNGPDLDALLSAYLSPAPPSTSHKTISPSRSISSSSTLSIEAEDSGVDSLAPLVFGRPQREESPMGDIMEVLSF
ncbi:hypothetical protein FPOAC2_12653 [Fusarium poae]|jgi:hypothetical protein|uniref:Uncharacterized protein n=1 Tax=Fusarium poae TaxID=36050 RepID=A0A1B8AH14_FUSPO|nr:hypothetical protein FPOAC1_012320 [Fusarium poae]KAG8667488.1 hypothetical protein FPOAC1_012320 [Fusarium poae]OBS19710.1 hypothetical protein FPOA_11435 [Fusarium poae]